MPLGGHFYIAGDIWGGLSNLFGGNKEDKALREAIAHIHCILGDEQFQLELVHPAMKAMLEFAPACDKDPNGTGPFGFTETNLITVNGPIGQLVYLSRLETQSGQRILFHCLGAIGMVDVFEAVSFDGAEWFILFVDLSQSRRSHHTLDGFRFTKDAAQFSGFYKFCDNFPYGFVEKKVSQRETGLSMAYLTISNVLDQIQNHVFNRLLVYKFELGLVQQWPVERSNSIGML